MTHLSDERLILYYYGEDGACEEIEAHLGGCAGCREAYGGLQRLLNVMDAAPTPQLPAAYAEQVWRRLQPALGARRRWAVWLAPRRLVLAASMAALMMAAFIAGRYSPRSPQVAVAPQRVLMVAVGEHLERSQMVLVELANAEPGDITEQQTRAADLVSANRLYRQTAVVAGEAGLAGVLEELERVLLEVAHGPSELAQSQLEDLQRRIEAQGILFKVRVLSVDVREQRHRL